MYVGIEKIEIGISLLDYNFGQTDYFKLHGVFGLEWVGHNCKALYMHTIDSLSNAISF